jgi:hypothetical protein
VNASVRRDPNWSARLAMDDHFALVSTSFPVFSIYVQLCPSREFENARQEAHSHLT